MKQLLIFLIACSAINVYAQAPADVSVPLKTFDVGEEYLHQSYVNIKTNFLYIPTYDTIKKELKIHSYNHLSNTWSIIYTDTASRTIEYGKSGPTDFIIVSSEDDRFYNFLKILKVKGGNVVEDIYEPILENRMSSFFPFFGKTHIYAFPSSDKLWHIDLETDSIFTHDLPSPNGRDLKIEHFGYKVIYDDKLIFTLHDQNDFWDRLTYSYQAGKGFELLSDRDIRLDHRTISHTDKYTYVRENNSDKSIIYRTEKGKYDMQKMYDSYAKGGVVGYQDYAFLLVSEEKTIYSMKDKLYKWSRFNGYQPGNDAFVRIGEDKMANIPRGANSWYVFDIKTGDIIATGALKRKRWAACPTPNRGKVYITEEYSKYYNCIWQLNSDGTTQKISLGIQDRKWEERRDLIPIFSEDHMYCIFKDKGQLRLVGIMETHARLDVKCFVDENSNGMVDGKETILEQSGVQLIDSKTDAVLEVDNGGIHLPKYFGNYTLNVKAPNFYGLTTTSTFNLHPDSIKGDTTLYVGLEKMKDTTLAEVFINNHSFRCGFPGTSKSTITNTGSADLRGVVKIKYHSAISIKSFDIQPDSSHDSVYYWTMPRVKPFEKWSVKAKLTWPGVKFRRKEITVDVDATLKSNQHYSLVKENFSELMGCAYDPNDKAVSPNRENHDGAILPGEVLTYKIRFQNTGNDTAFNVRLVDTLSKHLNWETFRVLDQSHDMNTKLGKDGVVEFMFNNILLPDSNRDEPNSHGYVIYRIQPLKNLPVLSEITNKADIFFDYNPPITTNTTKSVYRDYLVSDQRAKLETELFSIYPNPTKDMVLVEFNEAEFAQVKVISSDGRVQLAQTIQSGEQLDLSQLYPGLYFLEAKVDGKTQMTKVLKQ